MKITNGLKVLSFFALLAVASTTYAQKANAACGAGLSLPSNCNASMRTGLTAGVYGFDLSGQTIDSNHPAVANGEILVDSQGHVLGGFITCNFRSNYDNPQFINQITSGCYCFTQGRSGFLTFNTNESIFGDGGVCGTDDDGADLNFTATTTALHLTSDSSDLNFDEGLFLPMSGRGEHE